jgi:hypothetical protein
MGGHSSNPLDEFVFAQFIALQRIIFAQQSINDTADNSRFSRCDPTLRANRGQVCDRHDGAICKRYGTRATNFLQVHFKTTILITRTSLRHRR